MRGVVMWWEGWDMMHSHYIIIVISVQGLTSILSGPKGRVLALLYHVAMSLPQDFRISAPFHGCGSGAVGRDGERAILWRDGQNRTWSSLTFPVRVLPPFPHPTTQQSCAHFLSLSPFQTDTDALKSTSLSEETATPVSSACPWPVLCLAVAAGLRGNTLCSPWWLGFFFFFFGDEDLKIFYSIMGYPISHANKHCARAYRKQGRKPELRIVPALPFFLSFFFFFMCLGSEFGSWWGRRVCWAGFHGGKHWTLISVYLVGWGQRG